MQTELVDDYDAADKPRAFPHAAAVCWILRQAQDAPCGRLAGCYVRPPVPDRRGVETLWPQETRIPDSASPGCGGRRTRRGSGRAALRFALFLLQQGSRLPVGAAPAWGNARLGPRHLGDLAGAAAEAVDRGAELDGHCGHLLGAGERLARAL